MDTMLGKEKHQPAPGQIYQVLDDGRFAFWFDAHTLQTFSQCKQMFYLKNVSFAPQSLHRKGPLRACISIGSWWSRVSELFYKHMAVKGQYTTLMDMLTIAAKSWVESDMDSMRDSQPDKYEKFAIPISSGEYAKHFPGGVPMLLEELYHKKAEALRAQGKDEAARKIEGQTVLPLGPLLMAGQYFQKFAEQDARDWKVIAAEAPFGQHGEVVVGETDKVVVYWQGKPDLVIWEEKTGVLAPLDQKTKDYIPWDVEVIWKPHNQMSGYVYALENIAGDLGFGGIVVDRCVLSVCGRLQPATPRTKGAAPKPRFVRVRPSFSRDEISEWQRGVLYKAEELRHCIEASDSQGTIFTRNESACHLYGGCEYRGICSRPYGVRDIIIQSDYAVSDPWSPFDDED